MRLPLPPSANRYWRRGRNGVLYRSAEADAYKTEVAYLLLRRSAQVAATPVAITAHVYVGNRSRDLDNCLKVLLDSLQGFVYVNDNQVKELHAYWHHDTKDPRVELDWRLV